jgi:hypothetical protein
VGESVGAFRRGDWESQNVKKESHCASSATRECFSKGNKMNPIAKRKVTAAERITILADARKTWDSSSHSHLLARSDEEYLQAIDNGLEVVDSETIAQQPMNAVEKAEFERGLHHSIVMERLFGDRVADRSTGCAALDESWKPHQETELQEFLKPPRDAQNALDKMIEKAVEKVVWNLESTSRVPLAVRLIPERQALMPMLRSGIAENPNSDATRFLAAFVAGDNDGMRAVVRQVVSA